MTGITEYQRARELTERLDNGIRNNTPEGVVAAIARSYAELAHVAVWALATLDDMPENAREEWAALLKVELDEDAEVAAGEAQTGTDIVAQLATETAAAAGQLDIDRQTDSALVALFPRAVVEQIHASEAVNALRYRVREHCENTGTAPAHVLGYLLDARTRTIAGSSVEDPAAYLAAKVRDL